MMFLEIAPIQAMSKIVYDRSERLEIDAAEPSGFISAIAMKCRSLKSISLTAYFYFQKVVECCRDIEEMYLSLLIITLVVVHR
jgi:hypothetical protein